MTHVLMSWFKENIERWKTSHLKETVENADQHEAVYLFYLFILFILFLLLTIYIAKILCNICT